MQIALLDPSSLITTTNTTAAGTAANSRCTVHSAVAQPAPCMLLLKLCASISQQHNKKTLLPLFAQTVLHSCMDEGCQWQPAIYCLDLHPCAFVGTCEAAGWNCVSCICRKSSAGSRRPNPGDHATPAKKCIVMSVAIPVLPGACLLGAGLLIGPHLVGKLSGVKTSVLSW